MVVFVSAYLLSDSIRRPLAEYFTHFYTLANSGIEIYLFLDEKLKDSPEEQAILQHKNVKIIKYISLDTSWYPDNPSSFVLPQKRNTPKDTLQYLIIQLMKLKLLNDTANIFPEHKYLAWIDFSIFHMITNKELAYERLKNISLCSNFITTHIIAPSPCSNTNIHNLFDTPIWYFAGSFLLGHRELFAGAYLAQMDFVKTNLPRITWEVNYWYMMHNKFKIYYGDHNDTILNLPIQDFQISRFKEIQ